MTLKNFTLLHHPQKTGGFLRVVQQDENPSGSFFFAGSERMSEAYQPICAKATFDESK